MRLGEWFRPQSKADESLDELKKGSMLPGFYTFGGAHSDSKLPTEEAGDTFLDGLANAPGSSRVRVGRTAIRVVMIRG